jgi:hypothetical protein
MSALSLYKKHSQSELIALDQAISDDPVNFAPAGGIFRFTPKAQKRMSDIAQAISFHMADTREISGDHVKVSGYTGRTSNR